MAFRKYGPGLGPSAAHAYDGNDCQLAVVLGISAS